MSAGPPVVIAIRPGAWVTSDLPGGFTDALTGIQIPGPKVKVDALTRRIIAVTELPNPVQLPHFKVIDRFERTPGYAEPQHTERELAFDEFDDGDISGGLFAALQTGTIKYVDDAKVQDLFPATWAARRDHIVFRRREPKEPPMADLIEQFQDRIAEERAAQAKISADGAVNAPPPPRKRES